jgi:hypothetical protein
MRDSSPGCTSSENLKLRPSARIKQTNYRYVPSSVFFDVQQLIWTKDLKYFHELTVRCIIHQFFANLVWSHCWIAFQIARNDTSYMWCCDTCSRSYPVPCLISCGSGTNSYSRTLRVKTCGESGGQKKFLRTSTWTQNKKLRTRKYPHNVPNLKKMHDDHGL